MRLSDPGWLFLLILLPIPLFRGRNRPRFRWPTLLGFAGSKPSWVERSRGVPGLLRAVAVACLIVAMARPQTVGGQVRIAARGVAIVVALDRSRSMTAEDFPAGDGKKTTSRLAAARETFARFVSGRPDDLIGLIVFANEPDRLAPPTLDHRVLIDFSRSIRPAHAGEEGTNLGYAIIAASGDLAASPPGRKVLVLLTDGEDRPAVPKPIDPRKAAEIARGVGVTIHTVAVSRPQESSKKAEAGPDRVLLDDIARIGGGRAFSASDAVGLDAIFAEIDRLEKSPVRGTVRTRYREEYSPWVIAAVMMLVVDRLMMAGRWRRVP